MKKLTIALVGLGRIGWGTHLPKIAQHAEQYTLVGVVDLAQDRLAEAKARYGVNGYTDIAAMIAAEHPDLVVIASPTHMHREHACTCMELGCDVFLDKPMAESYESACAIARCSQETGRKLMIFQPVRAQAATNQVMELIRTGKIGDIPAHLKDAHYDGAGKLGRGLTYQYPHSFPNHYIKQQYLPDALRDRVYYEFGDNKTEQAAKAYLQRIRSSGED